MDYGPVYPLARDEFVVLTLYRSKPIKSIKGSPFDVIVTMPRLFKEFCDKVIGLDPSIRFVGVADEHGLLVSTSERKNLEPLLNREETQQYAITAATRQYTRVGWQRLLGKIDYTCSHYDKLLRATIPITDQENHLVHVIIFTFDVQTPNFHEIIMKKIIPLINQSSALLSRH